MIRFGVIGQKSKPGEVKSPFHTVVSAKTMAEAVKKAADVWAKQGYRVFNAEVKLVDI